MSTLFFYILYTLLWTYLNRCGGRSLLEVRTARQNFSKKADTYYDPNGLPVCAVILLVTVLLSRSHSSRSPDRPPHRTEFPSQQKHLKPETQHHLELCSQMLASFLPLQLAWDETIISAAVALPLFLLRFHRWDHHSRLDIYDLHAEVGTGCQNMSAVWGRKNRSNPCK